MNTQTHLLLTAVLLARSAGPAGLVAGPAAGLAAGPAEGLAYRRSRIACNAAAMIGGLLPDASLFVMWGQARLRGIPERDIWSLLYFSETWQRVGAITNSAPLYLLLALAAYAAGGRVSRSRPAKWAGAVLCFALAALVHLVTDLPLHADDGHPHFWPVSNWIFASPVSYWDPRHYGSLWAPNEIALALGMIVILWRRFEAAWVRGLLSLTLVSYGAMTLFWARAFS